MQRSGAASDDARQPTCVLITGATAGIGRSTALHLAQRGYHVVATGRRKDALGRLAAVGARMDVGANLSVELLDVTNRESIARCREAVETARGDGPDVVVNNAGFSAPGPLELVNDTELQAQFDTNVFGVLAVIREFLPRMRARGAGRIVNVSSVMGRMALPLHGPYNASKYAVEGLTDALRMELRPFGVTVVTVEPGTTNTTGHRTRALEHLQRYGSDASPYAVAVRGVEKAYAKAFGRAPEADKVARLIERAIADRHPAARYISLGDRLTLAFAHLAPTPVVDAVKRRTLGYAAGTVGPTTSSA